jgi:hypothetical protein
MNYVDAQHQIEYNVYLTMEIKLFELKTVITMKTLTDNLVYPPQADPRPTRFSLLTSNF